MAKSTPQTPFCHVITATWRQRSTSNEAGLSPTVFPWDISSKFPWKETQNCTNGLASSNFKPASGVQPLKEPPQALGWGCESRTRVNGHSVALRSPPARAAVFLPRDLQPCPSRFPVRSMGATGCSGVPWLTAPRHGVQPVLWVHL